MVDMVIAKCVRNSNISAKYYENVTMLSRVIAKNIYVSLRHSVEIEVME